MKICNGSLQASVRNHRWIHRLQLLGSKRVAFSDQVDSEGLVVMIDPARNRPLSASIGRVSMCSFWNDLS
jgi:hypothetical protein